MRIDVRLGAAGGLVICLLGFWYWPRTKDWGWRTGPYTSTNMVTRWSGGTLEYKGTLSGGYYHHPGKMGVQCVDKSGFQLVSTMDGTIDLVARDGWTDFVSRGRVPVGLIASMRIANCWVIAP